MVYFVPPLTADRREELRAGVKQTVKARLRARGFNTTPLVDLSVLKPDD